MYACIYISVDFLSFCRNVLFFFIMFFKKHIHKKKFRENSGIETTIRNIKNSYKVMFGRITTLTIGEKEKEIVCILCFCTFVKISEEWK